ncbi:hypothetical protein DYB36_003104 [Aphanomyces astaci]|uniref:Uncharacterized protein n=2 Tax=Aphanomyces astaci TaxID=112090 RepID=A0A397EKU3_APHAT|nr:hypothetical protein DYB36_003104 [Aphanomyces astaci]RHY84151.1 hypothetical protein DYB31_005828 [Aphanomyces astaci]
MGMARNVTLKDDAQPTKKKDAGAKKGKQNAKQEEVVVDYASLDHPYAVVLNKKLRSFKKKQEKIKALEDSLKGQSKQLNEQQLEVLSNKGFVDKMIGELEALRQQFVETVIAAPAANTTPEAKNDEDVAVVTPSEEGDVSSLNHLNEDVSDNGNDPVDDLDDEDKAASVDSATSASNAIVNAVDLDDEKLEFVHSVLKLLHAVSLHQALGHDVPMALDYFVKVLVGGTRPPAEVSFPENLAESLEEAKRYVLKSDKILACDMSYRQLSEAVDHLVAPRPAPKQEVVVEVAPQINFFTESELDNDATITPSDAATDVRSDEETFAVVDVVEKVPVATPQTNKSRPHSGNRRNKNSPREAGGEGGDKPHKPRKVYQPRNPKTPDQQEQNGGNQRNATPQRVAYVPKATEGGEKPQRPTTSNTRRSNSKQDRPRPKKVDQDISP